MWRSKVAAHFVVARRNKTYFFKAWRSRSLALMMSNLGGLAVERIDVICVGLFSTLESAGIYGTASRIVPLISIGQRFIVPVIGPKIAWALAMGDDRAAVKEVRMGLAINGLIAIVGLACIWLFSRQILSIFGSSFVAGAPILRILSIAHVMIALGSNFGVLVAMGPRPWGAAAAIWGVLVPMAIVCAVATCVFGPIGAAVTVAVGIIVYVAAIFRLSLKVLRSSSTLAETIRQFSAR
jgi:O-antigen/teichoic acid export membrane protein